MPQQNNDPYLKAVEWFEKNKDQEIISDEIKNNFLSFNSLSAQNKAMLIVTLDTLSKKKQLPKEIEEALTSLIFPLNELPLEMISIIGSFLDQSTQYKLASTSGKMFSLFSKSYKKKALDKFLQHVAFGNQDKVEALFRDIYKGNAIKIQEALVYKGKFVDYSNREFDCTAYEYAYWAGDSHMCRMLELNMNAATKKQMLILIDRIESIDRATNQPIGLEYRQNGTIHRRAHFDFQPLIAALQLFDGSYDAWFAVEDFVSIDNTMKQIGREQANAPAHVLNEYCKPDRPFFPLPSFNIDEDSMPKETLPRVLTFKNWNKDCNDVCFPLPGADAGLGLDLALFRGTDEPVGASGLVIAAVHQDLEAIQHLALVRSNDRRVSREHLSPPAVAQKLFL